MKIRDKILIIEDDSRIVGFISAILQSNDYDVIAADTGKKGLSMSSSHCPDLVLLDLGLPDMDGVSVIRELRCWTRLPVIVISARTRERDKVEALDAGADDYVSKPFGAAELLARIRVALRHSRVAPDSEVTADGMLRVKDMVIDYNRHRVLVGGENARLTQNEFKIVALLGKYAGKVLTYDFIKKALWGPQATGNNQILRVNMANIRRKIEKNPAEPDYIFTEIGVGYRMTDEE